MQMKHRCAACMSTKQNCIKINSHCGKSNVSQNTRLIDRATEILLTFKKSHEEENRLPPNSKIQDTDTHWFYFDPVRDPLHL